MLKESGDKIWEKRIKPDPIHNGWKVKINSKRK